MTEGYFELIEGELRDVVRRRAHLPWYRRLGRGHRRLLVAAFAAAVIAGPSLAAAGVFQSGPQVTATTCSASGGSTSAAHSACTFVLSDGRRFACPQAVAISHPSVEALERDRACLALSPATVGASVRSLQATLSAARRCLSGHGFPVNGGLASGQGGGRPAGELIAGSASSGAIIAFYGDSHAAEVAEPSLVQNAQRFGGEVQRVGAVTVVWIRPPSVLRGLVQQCVLR